MTGAARLDGEVGVAEFAARPKPHASEGETRASGRSARKRERSSPTKGATRPGHGLPPPDRLPVSASDEHGLTRRISRFVVLSKCLRMPAAKPSRGQRASRAALSSYRNRNMGGAGPPVASGRTVAGWPPVCRRRIPCCPPATSQPPGTAFREPHQCDDSGARKNHGSRVAMAPVLRAVALARCGEVWPTPAIGAPGGTLCSRSQPGRRGRQGTARACGPFAGDDPMIGTGLDQF